MKVSVPLYLSTNVVEKLITMSQGHTRSDTLGEILLAYRQRRVSAPTTTSVRTTYSLTPKQCLALQDFLNLNGLKNNNEAVTLLIEQAWKERQTQPNELQNERPAPNTELQTNPGI